MSDETRINQEGDEIALNFTTLTSNIQAILDEPEVETVLGRIQMKKEDFLNEVLADMRSEDGGVDFSEKETESSYSKKCVRVKVFQKLVEAEGRAASQKLKEEPVLAEAYQVERFLADYEAASEAGSVKEMNDAIKNNMVFPIIDKDGNEVFIILTPEQQKEFSKLAAELNNMVNDGAKKANLQNAERTTGEESLDNAEKKDVAETEQDAVEPEQDADKDPEKEPEQEKVPDSKIEETNDTNENRNDVVDESLLNGKKKAAKRITIDTLGYDEYNVKNTEYFEMHPEQRDATFVQGKPGEDISIFVKNLMLLQKDSDKRIVGVFHDIPLDATQFKSASDLEAAFNEAVQQIQEDNMLDPGDRDLKSKGEFINLNGYYSQFYDSKDNVQSYVNQYSGQNQDPRMAGAYDRVITINPNCEKISDFLEAAMFTAANSMGNTYVEIEGIVVCATDFQSVDELYQKIGELQQALQLSKEGVTQESKGYEQILDTVGTQPENHGIDTELSQMNEGVNSTRINNTLDMLTMSSIDGVDETVNMEEIVQAMEGDAVQSQLLTAEQVQNAKDSVARAEAEKARKEAERIARENRDLNEPEIDDGGFSK